VDRYCEEVVGATDPALDAAVRDSANAGLPDIQVSPLQGKLLHLIARSIGARRILEVGTLGGYSTIWLARALPPEGKLVSLELEPKHAQVARANLLRAGVADRVEIRLGPAGETLPKLASEHAGPFDLVFVDADKVGYPEYLEWAVRLARKGSVIVADNVVRRGDVADAEGAEEASRGVRAMNERLARDKRLSATIIQTVGRKGYDGFTYAVVL
jgi:predicted O-methyltransferase YrrM